MPGKFIILTGCVVTGLSNEMLLAELTAHVGEIDKNAPINSKNLYLFFIVQLKL